MAVDVTRPAALTEVETFFVLNALVTMWHSHPQNRAVLPGSVIYTDFTICTFASSSGSDAGRDWRAAEAAVPVDVNR